MIYGMTGFGAADFSVDKVKGTVEIKTVNHRYLDPAFYLPSGFAAYEEKIAKALSRELKRGRVTVSVRITEKPQVNIVMNAEAVKHYVDFARTLSKRYGIRNEMTSAGIMSLPGVIEAKEVFIEAAVLWPVVEKAIGKALASVVAMRRREGMALKKDIGGQLSLMQRRIAQIRQRVQKLLKEKKETATDDEFSAYQKSNDVNEELARLAHHIDEAKALLNLRQEAGKKIDFIAQEMQRETNTIGSKVQDKEVSATVIALKGKVEKIREQANNVE